MSHSIFCKSNEVPVTSALPQPLLINFLLQEGELPGLWISRGGPGAPASSTLLLFQASSEGRRGFGRSPSTHLDGAAQLSSRLSL